MEITVIGTGYVGLTLGVCLADLGNNVIGVDIDKTKIDTLKSGIVPFYEPGLSDLLKRNLRENRIIFTTDIKSGIQKSEAIFIAVGTPPGKDHRADLTFVQQAAKDIGRYINNYKVIVNKSTVPVGTASLVKKIILDEQKKNNKKIHFDVVSNPEFLREGAAVGDFFNPDRIIIGTDSRKSEDLMKQLYKGITRTGKPIVITDIKSAELIKYAANAMLATRISFMNEISRLCEKVGADIKQVANGIGLDTRIGSRFLQAGVGYGGSCFPKDIKALILTGKDNGIDFKILRSVEEVNDEQKLLLISKIRKLIPNIKNKTVAVWGMAFKPKTDDMREAPSIVIIHELQKLGANIKAFDPEAKENAKKILKNITFCNTPYEAVDGSDALVIVTEWNEFRDLDKKKIKSLLKQPIIIDGRNIYDCNEMKKLGFKYISVGR